MKKSFISIPLLIVAIALQSCDTAEKTTKKDSNISITVDLDSTLHQMQGGIGVNFTSMDDSLPVVQLDHQYRSYGGSCWGANPAANDTASWNKVWSYADWLGLDFCRLLTTRKAFEPQEGKFTFESPEMKTLYKYLDYCQSRGTDVFLQNFANNVAWLSVPEAGKDPIKILRSAPNDIEKYTDGLMTLLNHLVATKKYTCIKYICITNEPFENWSWYIGKYNPDQYESPEAAFKLMQEKLAKSNLGVKLSGPDVSTYLSANIHPDRSPFFKYFDAYDIHSYVTRPDWHEDSTMTFEDGGKGELNSIKQSIKQYGEWKNHAKANGNKPFFITEMGSFMYGFGEDTVGMSTYDALLKDVESVLRYSNIGLDGFMRWSFLNRGNLDGKWQMINTWDIEKGKLLPTDQIAPQPIPFYLWGTLTRYTPKYAKVVKSTVDGGILNNIQRVFATTYRSPNNADFSIFLLNDSDSTYTTTLDIKGNTTQKLQQIVITPDLFNGSKAVKLNATEYAKSATVTLPAKSITVISSYILAEKDKGIIMQ